MMGMSCTDGAVIVGINYLKQRLRDALSTTKGSQVLLRERGTLLPSLIDAPLNNITFAKLMIEIAHTLESDAAGLPDMTLKQIRFLGSHKGQLQAELTIDWQDNLITVAL